MIYDRKIAVRVMYYLDGFPRGRISVTELVSDTVQWDDTSHNLPKDYAVH